MKRITTLSALIAISALSACQTTTSSNRSAANSDACGASKYQNLVGGPSLAAIQLDIPDSSRHYGSTESVATNNPSRLNFVHSGTAVEAVTDPNSTVTRVFCG